MSFRGQLTLFFVAIVIVPMLVLAVLVVRITDDSRAGKADARLAAGLETARVIYEEERAGAAVHAEAIGSNPAAQRALLRGDREALAEIAERRTARRDVARVAFFDRDGELAGAGAPVGIASVRQAVETADRELVGAIEVAALEPNGLAVRIATLTGSPAAIVSGSETLAGSPGLEAAPAPGEPSASIELPDTRSGRAAALGLEGAPPGARVVIAVPAEEGFLASQPLVALVLVGFFGVAVAFIVVLMRALRRQTTEMLDAAQRIGEGDFSRQVPVQGNDEIAGLAREMNRMSGRLSEQVTRLRHQREEIERSVQRIGEAFSSGLDRTALLGIVLETAVSACDAAAGRVRLGERIGPVAEIGIEPGSALEAALGPAERDAERSGAAAAGQHGELRAIADVLHAPSDPEGVIGTLSVARPEREFSAGERQVLRYLIGQAAASVENIALHEQVAEQAVTDELTGLANRRHFLEWIEREAQRLQRFGGELSLVILDIDEFKEVNDERGHPQGDRVLTAIGTILEGESRGIDEVARYGGEEFVLGLPETPAAGAVEVAERIRERIAKTTIPAIDGGAPIRVTASFGVATMPADASGVPELIEASDSALYRAKQAGKNRVVASGRVQGTTAQGNPDERRS